MWIEIVSYVTETTDGDNVTPFAGVWIEIFCLHRFYSLCLVTPFAGVWIEILF